MKQVNIHQLVAEETYEQCKEVLHDFNDDKRLKNLNAIVFLSLKSKGARNDLRPMTSEKFKTLVHEALSENIPIGFDSCTAWKFMQVVKDHPKRAFFDMVAESCESTLFSSYVNVKGEFYPCSFAEGCNNIKPLQVTTCHDFLQDIWEHEQTIAFRERLIKSGKNELKCRKCLLFEGKGQRQMCACSWGLDGKRRRYYSVGLHRSTEPFMDIRRSGKWLFLY